MPRWRWQGTLDRIGDGEIEADTEQEAMELARDALQQGAPDYIINVEQIEDEDEE